MSGGGGRDGAGLGFRQAAGQAPPRGVAQGRGLLAWAHSRCRHGRSSRACPDCGAQGRGRESKRPPASRVNGCCAQNWCRESTRPVHCPPAAGLTCGAGTAQAGTCICRPGGRRNAVGSTRGRLWHAASSELAPGALGRQPRSPGPEAATAGEGGGAARHLQAPGTSLQQRQAKVQRARAAPTCTPRVVPNSRKASRYGSGCGGGTAATQRLGWQARTQQGRIGRARPLLCCCAASSRCHAGAALQRQSAAVDTTWRK